VKGVLTVLKYQIQLYRPKKIIYSIKHQK
jgi:hypothetical protein